MRRNRILLVVILLALLMVVELAGELLAQVQAVFQLP